MRLLYNGAEALSGEPRNNGASSLMPRKSLDIKVTDNLVFAEKKGGGQCTLFLPSGKDMFGQNPIMGQGTSPLQVHRAAPYAIGKLSTTNICNFQSSFDPIFDSVFFTDYLILPQNGILI